MKSRFLLGVVFVTAIVIASVVFYQMGVRQLLSVKQDDSMRDLKAEKAGLQQQTRAFYEESSEFVTLEWVSLAKRFLPSAQAERFLARLTEIRSDIPKDARGSQYEALSGDVADALRESIREYLRAKNPKMPEDLIESELHDIWVGHLAEYARLERITEAVRRCWEDSSREMSRAQTAVSLDDCKKEIEQWQEKIDGDIRLHRGLPVKQARAQ